MIVQPQVRANKTVLRTVTELQSPGEISYSIPYRSVFSYTLLQGWLSILGVMKRLSLENSLIVKTQTKLTCL